MDLCSSFFICCGLGILTLAILGKDPPKNTELKSRKSSDVSFVAAMHGPENSISKPLISGRKSGGEIVPDTEVDEHTSEFAETLSFLNSKIIESTDSDQLEFTDIIDEQEIQKLNPRFKVEKGLPSTSRLNVSDIPNYGPINTDPKKRLKNATLVFAISLLFPWKYGWYGENMSGIESMYSITTSISNWGFDDMYSFLFIMIDLAPFVPLVLFASCWMYTESDQQFYSKMAKVLVCYFGIVTIGLIWIHLSYGIYLGEILFNYPGILLAGISGLIILLDLIPWSKFVMILISLIVLLFILDPEEFTDFLLGEQGDW